MPSPRPHPAPFNMKVLDTIKEMIADLPITTILDPFAGIGRIHLLRPKYETVGVEREPEWACQSQYNIVGDALQIDRLFQPGRFDAVVTSPSYGNRMADHHEARDGSRRNTYRHKLGRPIAPGSSAIMHWGDEYREFHETVWAKVTDLAPAFFVLNMKDHLKTEVKGGPKVLQPVTQWHWDVLQRLGWNLREVRKVWLRGNRYGANADVRVDHETVALFERRRH